MIPNEYSALLEANRAMSDYSDFTKLKQQVDYWRTALKNATTDEKKADCQEMLDAALASLEKVKTSINTPYNTSGNGGNGKPKKLDLKAIGAKTGKGLAVSGATLLAKRMIDNYHNYKDPLHDYRVFKKNVAQKIRQHKIRKEFQAYKNEQNKSRG